MFVSLKNKIYRRSSTVLICWLYLFLLDGVGQVKTNEPDKQANGVQTDVISQVVGMSAIGYFPLWRVGLSHQGIELGMPQLETGLLPYSEIKITADSWWIRSYCRDIQLSLTIFKKPGRCSMSKQWYPYQAKLEIKMAGQALQTYNGTAMERGQKPLPPHPEKTTSLDWTDAKKEVIYHFLDRLKFALMKRDLQEMTSLLHFPLRVNSSNDAAFMISSVRDWRKRANEVIDQYLISKIINSQYDALYESDQIVGLKGGVLLLKIKNGKPKITTINKN